MPKRESGADAPKKTETKSALMRAFNKLVAHAGLEDSVAEAAEKTMEIGEEKTKMQVVFAKFTDPREGIKEITYVFLTVDDKSLDKYVQEIVDRDGEDPYYCFYKRI